MSTNLNKTPKKSWISRLNHWRIDNMRKLKYSIIFYYYYVRYEKRRKRFAADRLADCNSIAIVLRGKGIGDAIALSGFFHELRGAGKKVYCICNEKLASIFNSMIEIDGVYTVPDRAQRADILALNLKFDAVVLFSDPETYKNDLLNIIILTAINHKYALGYNRDNRFFDISILRDEIGCHCTARYTDAAMRFGVDIKEYKYYLKFSEECLADIEAFMSRLGDREFVVFNPKASDKVRSLSPEVICSTLSWLQSNSRLQVVVYNVSDNDIIERFPNVIFNPFKDMDRCSALLGKSSFVITVDTSFVHVGRFFDVPLIGIYNNRLESKKHNNNIYWGPNYENACQVFSLDHLNTESGDDLRLMPFEPLEQALINSKKLY